MVSYKPGKKTGHKEKEDIKASENCQNGFCTTLPSKISPLPTVFTHVNFTFPHSL